MVAIRLLFLQIICIVVCLAIDDEETTTEVESSCTGFESPTELPAGYVNFPNIGSSYKVSSTTATWTKARDECASIEGGRLAVIDTPEKIEYVRRLRSGVANLHVGIFRECYTGPWISVDGSPIEQYLSWRIYYKSGSTRNCLAVGGSTPGLGNYPCTVKRRYVCEVPDSQC